MTSAAERRTPRPARKGGARQSAARLAAVQALYQIDHSRTRADTVLEEFLRFRLGESFDTEHDVAPSKTLFAELVRGVSARGPELDDIIAGSLTGSWTPQRLEYILRAILRAGVYELLARDGTPARVVISEYVDIAHAFYDGPEPATVNGILDRVARALRPEEFQTGEGDGAG